ncbi:enhancer of yellow 2 transcription factor isoform X2 [Rhopalosiphum maidis]|uniref:enhancer of yellow 2 transcription factor isoform X2 n=1 Tax=Rhopalosiphum maidis TaxID=43146 RepID=UPI000EFE8B0E|nr:enhancer of yellow 2 transcription factor isoform X2 [Rhopalosiphum maidis]
MSQNETTFVDEENFKSLVCRRLVECGWMDEVTMLCKEKLKNRLSKGQAVKSITEEDLFNDVAPDARRMLPDTIKRELKVKVQNKLLQTAGYFDETDSES